MKTENKTGAGRPALGSKKRKKRIAFYVNEDELKRLKNIELSILKHSPDMTLNDFFRLIIDKYDDTLIHYLNEPQSGEVKKYMRTLHATNALFKG